MVKENGIERCVLMLSVYFLFGLSYQYELGTMTFLTRFSKKFSKRENIRYVLRTCPLNFFCIASTMASTLL